MQKSFNLNPLIILVFVGFFINSCSGQVSTNGKTKQNAALKVGPIITGTPPNMDTHPNPTTDFSLVSQYIRSIFQDSKGHYWFGPAGSSVARYDGKTLHYFSKNKFFNGNDQADNYYNSVHAITEDKYGRLWFGTDHGVVMYDGDIFRSYTEEHGLSNIRIGRKSILVDQSGTIWVGTKAGVFRHNPSIECTNEIYFTPFDLLPSINVTDIMEDKKGDLWFASKEQGIFHYNGKIIKNISVKKGLGDNYSGGIAQDQAGNYWFTFAHGITRYDGKNFTDFTEINGITHSGIWGLFIEASGIIWITTKGSTTRFDPALPSSNPKALTVFTPKDGLNCCVQSMYQDRLGNMWWGTGEGLYRFDGEGFYQVKQDGPWR